MRPSSWSRELCCLNVGFSISYISRNIKPILSLPIKVGSWTVAGPGLVVSAAILPILTVGVQGRCSTLPPMLIGRILRTRAQGP